MTTGDEPSALRNHLIAALSEDVQQRILPDLQQVELERDDVLYESGDKMRQAYFPTDSIISLLYVMEDGRSAEISVVGMNSAGTLSTHCRIGRFGNTASTRCDEVDYLEGALDGKDFFVADEFTIADIAVGAQMTQLSLVAEPIDASKWPALAAHTEAMKARNGFAESLATCNKMLAKAVPETISFA